MGTDEKGEGAMMADCGIAEEVAVQADIAARDDVERLVRAFYNRATADEVIGFLFTDVARLDLEAHLPVMFAFWETVLLGVRSYAGNPMQVHVDLHRKSPLLPRHFERWLLLWEQSVDELFAGPRADEAKTKARAIARSMQLRLGAAGTAPVIPHMAALRRSH